MQLWLEIQQKLFASLTKKMIKKILFVLHLPPPIHGSAMVGQYIKDSRIIQDQFDSHFINLGTSLTINEIGKNPVRKISLYIKIIGAVIKRLCITKYDILYVALTAKGIGFYKDFVIVLLAKLFGVTLLLHFHNKGVADRQHRFFDNLLYSILFKNAKVILLSPLLYYDIKKYVKPEDVFYCPNGIPENHTLNKLATINTSNVNLLFLSNLIESKGVYVLLEACRCLAAKQLPFTCTFVGGEGDITAEDVANKIKKLKLENHVQYLGKLYGEHKTKVFASSDVFVLPTFYPNECFPLVLLEAMQNSMPIISTFEGGIPDIVQEGVTGLLVKQKDTKSLAEQLEVLIKNSNLRANMGFAAKAKFDQEYTLPLFEKRFANILTKV